MIDNMKFPTEVQAPHPNRNDKAPLKRPNDHPMGQDGNAKPVDDPIDQSGGTHGLPDGRDRKTGLFHGAVKYLPRPAPVFAQQKFLPQKFFHRDFLTLAKFAFRGADYRPVSYTHLRAHETSV